MESSQKIVVVNVEVTSLKNIINAIILLQYIFVCYLDRCINYINLYIPFLPFFVQLHDVNQVKASFTKLSKVCCPSSQSNESKFLSAFEESKWLNQVRNPYFYVLFK